MENKTIEMSINKPLKKSNQNTLRKLSTVEKKRQTLPIRKSYFGRKASAVLVRLLFILHTSLGIWRVSLMYNINYVYFLVGGVVLLLLELIFMLAVRQGEDLKWVSPCVFLYLITIVPCLWLIEVKIMDTNLARFECSEFLEITEQNSNISTRGAEKSAINDDLLNATVATNVTSSSYKNDNKSFSESDSKTKEKTELLKILNEHVYMITHWLKAADQLNPNTWKLALHQTLLFVLVIGRWLLPKGEISRDELSQLLLVFIAVGADILEFATETISFEELDDCSHTILYFLYAVWSVSLSQFCLVLTASKSRKARLGYESVNENEQQVKPKYSSSLFTSAEVWGVLVTLFVQDIPFLVFRVYIMVVHNIVHQMIVFFTGKNVLVVILQTYRLIVIKLKANKKKRKEGEMETIKVPKDVDIDLDIAFATILSRCHKGTTYKQKKGKEVIVQLAFETDVYNEIVRSRQNTQV